MRFITYFFLVLLLIAPDAFAKRSAKKPQMAQICRPLKGLELSHSPSCPAFFWGLDGSKTCLGPAAFSQWIDPKQKPTRCFQALIKTRERSPLLDQAWSPRQDSPAKINVKTKLILTVLHPMQLSVSSAPAVPPMLKQGSVAPPQTSQEFYSNDLSNLWFTALAKLDRARWRLATSVRDQDRLGVFSTLFLDVKPPHVVAQESQKMRHLGIIHVATEAGVHLYALRSAIFATVFWVGGHFLGARGITIVARSLTFLAWFALWVLSGFRGALLRPLSTFTIRGLAGVFGIKLRDNLDLALVALTESLIWLFVYLKYPHYFAVVGVWFFKGGLHYYGAILGGRLTTGRWYSKAIGSWLWLALLDLCLNAEASPLTPFFNLITLPLFVTLLFPLWSVGVLWAPLSLEPLRAGVDLFTRLLEALLLPFASVGSVTLSLSISLGIVLTFIALLLFEGVKVRAFVCGMILFSLITVEWARTPMSPVQGSLHVDQLDVGQGDSALVYSASHAGLIDVGSQHVQNHLEWKRRLFSRGMTQLDFVLFTHLDEDHAGGLIELLKEIPVKCVYVNRLQWESPRGMKWRRLFAEYPQTVVVQKAELCIPPAFKDRVLVLEPRRGERIRGANAAMSAVLVEVTSRIGATAGADAGTRGWYANLGDSDKKQELAFLPRIRAIILKNLLILKLSHHGSKSSSPERLLAELRPRCIWVSAGVGNSYGHPVPVVLARAQKFARVFQTNQSGTLHSQDCEPAQVARL